MKLLLSSTFQFAALIIGGALLLGVEPDKVLDVAVYALGIYAGKEGVKYGSAAYKERK